MKLLFLDVYKNQDHESQKILGGYGTENDLGDGIIGKSLSYLIKRTVFWPAFPLFNYFRNLNREGILAIIIKKLVQKLILIMIMMQFLYVLLSFVLKQK